MMILMFVLILCSFSFSSRLLYCPLSSVYCDPFSIQCFGFHFLFDFFPLPLFLPGVYGDLSFHCMLRCDSVQGKQQRDWFRQGRAVPEYPDLGAHTHLLEGRERIVLGLGAVFSKVGEFHAGPDNPAAGGLRHSHSCVLPCQQGPDVFQ